MTDIADARDNELDRAAIRAMRRSYGEVGLDQLPPDPFSAFANWLKEAHENPFIVEANAWSYPLWVQTKKLQHVPFY